MKAVSRDLAYAADEKVLSVVSMVDGLANRAMADDLIAPLRHRLARLRPQRKLNFARLLFLPFDQLIVPAPQWRPMDATIPRSAVHALATIVRSALGPNAKPIDELIEARNAGDRASIEAATALLRPQAARILLAPPVSDAWDETGLGLANFVPLARRIGAVLAQYPLIDALVGDAERNASPPTTDAVIGVLAAIGRANPDASGMAIALLFARLPRIRPILTLAAAKFGNGADVVVRQDCERAVEALIGGLEAQGGTEAQISNTELSEAGAQVRRIAGLLEEAEGGAKDLGQRSRIQVLRQRLDASCQLRFSDGIANDLLTPLRNLAQSTAAMPTETLESAARALRELESEARVIGGGGIYDSLLRQAADTVRAIGQAESLDLVDQSRLVEILAGPETALAMFAARR
jgi:hypothetical protein